MKLKSMIVLVLLAPVLVCADKLERHVTTSETVSQKLTPNILEGTFTFYEESKEVTTIKEHLNALVSQVKKFDTNNEICRGGGYQIVPRYYYKDQKQTLVGYKGAFALECDFKSVDDYNTLVSQIEKVKASGVVMTQGMPLWKVSSESSKEAYIALRVSLLKLAQKQAKLFSKELNLKCDFSDISENPQPMQSILFENDAVVDMVSKGKSSKSTPIEAPIQQPVEISSQAIISYVCSDL